MITLQRSHQEFRVHLENGGRATATIIAYSKDIDQLVTFVKKLNRTHVHEVTGEDLSQFMKKFAEQGYTNKSISRKTNSVKTYFRFLLSQKYVEANPADRLSHPEVTNKAPRILDANEYRALRDVTRRDPRTYAVVELLLQTGMRISELHNLQLDDLEFSDHPKQPGKIRIRAYESHTERTIPFNQVAQTAIKDYLENRSTNAKCENVFITNTGKPWLIRNIRSTLARYFRKASLQAVTVNDLRHTFVAHQLERGASLTKISQIVGHKRLSTTEKYLQYVKRPDEETDTLEEL